MYADVITDSMKRAIKETDRRRKTQEEYNKKHGVVPRSIEKPLAENHESEELNELNSSSLKYLEKEMKKAARQLDFEKAAQLRDKLKKLKN
jgi:excinuclease ABC subunit B